MKKRLGLILLFVLATAVQVFAASASRTINYQGRLTDSTNAPVADGTYVMTFRLYDDANALLDSYKWRETHTMVATKNGYFNVVLGGIDKFSASHLDFNNQYWLGIQVNSDSEMSPRQALTGVPMTLNYDVPVGSIMAWHKNMPQTPGLSDQWVECNGQLVTDGESPYKDAHVPNLNGDATGDPLPVDSGGTTITSMINPVFLRGGKMSGVGQLDELKSHKHTYTAPTNPFNVDSGSYTSVIGNATVGQPTSNFGGPETRPVNMSVVWIMKIK